MVPQIVHSIGGSIKKTNVFHNVCLRKIFPLFYPIKSSKTGQAEKKVCSLRSIIDDRVGLATISEYTRVYLISCIKDGLQLGKRKPQQLPKVQTKTNKLVEEKS